MKLQGNILVITQWSFKDALVQTYTLPYVDMIRNIIPGDRKIIVVTAEQKQIALTDEEAGVINKEWSEKNMMLVAQPYTRFGIKKMFASTLNLLKLRKLIKKESIKTIHAFCTPAGGIAYLLSKMTGAELVIDSYEPHAESMVENGTWTKNGLAYRILFTLEKRQTKKAKVLIATTAGMKDYARTRYGVEVKNFFVKPACVDLDQFKPSGKDGLLLDELDLTNKIVCVYAGKLGGIYFKAEVFDFIRACYTYWGDDFRFLMLTNTKQEEIQEQIRRTSLPADIVISKFVFHASIPRYLSLGDFALNPVKPVSTKRYCTSIKDGEYWAMGLPVIISPNISDDSSIIEKEGTGVVINYNSSESYATAISTIEKLIRDRNVQNRICQQAIKYRSFEIARSIYKELYS